MIRFIATDMDGTLLDDSGDLPSNFYEVFNELKENNILFAAASGRQYFSLVEKFDKVKDDMMFIAENGTYVVYKNKEIYSNLLDRNIIDKFIDTTNKINNAYAILCGKECAYLEDAPKEVIDEISKYYARFEIVKNLKDIKADIIKLTICDFSGSEENSNNYFDEFRNEYKVTVSGKLWLDITNKVINKGVAIKKVQEAFNIEFDETMVFGDYLNDLDMMSSAYHSYAMENAHEDLKKVARFLAPSNEDNGVLNKIEEVVLKKVCL